LERVGDGSRREGVKLLNDNVRVGNQGSLVVDLSWGRVVVGRGIDEESGVEIIDGELHGEVDVGWNGVEVGRVLELGRRYVGSRENATHDRWVAAATLDLQAVSERNVGLGQAKVDKVVARRERCDLGRIGGDRAISVLLKASLDLGRVELKRALGITSTVVVPLRCGSATTNSKAVAGDGRSRNLLESGESEEDKRKCAGELHSEMGIRASECRAELKMKSGVRIID